MRIVKPFLLGLLVAASCAKESAPSVEKSEATPQSTQANLSKMPTKRTVDPADKPETCKGCHPTIYEEWSQTMHARAHHSRDPIYDAVRKVRIKKEGQDITRACGQCHNPRSSLIDDSPAALTGVSCATCHNVAAILDGPDRFGALRIRWALPGTFLGPHDLGKKQIDAHKLGNAPPHMKDGAELCLTCHDQLQNDKGVAACTTGPEWKAGESKETCVSCHMPLAAGPGTVDEKPDYHRSHRFFGPRAGWDNKDWAPVPRGVRVEAKLNGQKLTVTLINDTGHGYPSGFPGRMLLVFASGLDGKGESVWKTESVLNKVYVDDKGGPTLAPYATSLKHDTRLKPNEQRVLTFEVPKAVNKVNVQLAIRLLPPPLAKKLGLAGGPLDGHKTIATVTASR